MQHVADLKDPLDPQNRTYREINNSRIHKFGVGDIVTIDQFGNAFISRITRDCDGTPLYSIELHGIGEDDMTLYIKNPIAGQCTNQTP